MTRLTYKTASAAAAFIPIALLAAGCSSSSGGGGAYGGGSTTSSSAAPTSAAASSAVAGGGRYGGMSSSAAPAAHGTPVTATEQEFSITLSAKTFKAGTYTFTIHNTGKFSHNLTIEGPGVDKLASPIVSSGATGTLTVALQKGSYELWCAVDGHKDRGMDMTIMVS